MDNKDSLTLIVLAKEFRAHVINRDKQSLKRMSLDNIHCVSCIRDGSEPPKTYFVSVDEFIKVTIDPIQTSRLIRCIESDNPLINILRAHGADFESPELKKLKEVVIYELFYLTTKPNEIQAGHEGQQTGLQFIKLDSGFKLYGLTTVP